MNTTHTFYAWPEDVNGYEREIELSVSVDLNEDEIVAFEIEEATEHGDDLTALPIALRDCVQSELEQEFYDLLAKAREEAYEEEMDWRVSAAIEDKYECR